MKSYNEVMKRFGSVKVSNVDFELTAHENNLNDRKSYTTIITHRVIVDTEYDNGSIHDILKHTQYHSFFTFSDYLNSVANIILSYTIDEIIKQITQYDIEMLKILKGIYINDSRSNKLILKSLLKSINSIDVKNIEDEIYNTLFTKSMMFDDVDNAINTGKTICMIYDVTK